MPEFPVPKAKPRVHPQWQCSHGASSGGTGGTAPVSGAASAPFQVGGTAPVSGAASAPFQVSFHRCFFGLTADQAAQVDATKIVRCAWFGWNGRSVPVQNSLESALVAFDNDAAMRNSPNEAWPKFLLFLIPLPLFYEWIRNGKLIFGFRIRGDIYLDLVDPWFSLHPFPANPLQLPSVCAPWINLGQLKS